MSSLFNKRIKDTYSSLIKTEDNLPIGLTYSRLTDGDGNPLTIQAKQGSIAFDGVLDLTQADVLGQVGPTGPAGTSGTSGSSGVSGSAGTSGTSGVSGVAGSSGSSGTSGSSGVSGSAGTSGTSGVSPTGAITSVGPNTILNVWSGSQAQYNALSPTYSNTTIYFIE